MEPPIVPMWRTAGYLSLALLGCITVYRHSPGLLILPGIAFFLLHALVKRTSRIGRGSAVKPQAAASRLSGDGGCFPGSAPEPVEHAAATPRLIDGGSL